MSAPLCVLILEDKLEDAKLMAHELEHAGFEPNWTRVETESEYCEALTRPYDVILSDYALPQFDGLRAVDLLRERELDIPFILVSGTIGEDLAVEAMKRGAADYLLKDRMTRLGPAVARALEDKRVRAEKKRAEQALHESESKFRRFVEESCEGLVLVDEHAVVIEWNRAMEALTGLASDQVLGKAIWDVQWNFVRAERRTSAAYEQLKSMIQDALRTGSAPFLNRPVEAEIRRADGAPRTVLQAIFPIPTDRGFWIGSMTRDITEQKQAEAARRESEERLQRIIDTALDAIITVNGDQRIVVFNPAAEQMFRCAAAQAIGQSLDRFIPERFRMAHEGHVQKFGQGSTTKSARLSAVNVIGRRADGEEFPCEASISQADSPRGKVYTAILRDVTERKRAEEEIRYQANLLANVSDAIISTDLDFNIKTWNTPAQTMYGWSADEAIGRNIQDVVPIEFFGVQSPEAVEQFRREGHWQGIVIQRCKDGTKKHIQSSATLVLDPSGRPSAAVAVNRDITESVKRQRELAAIAAVSAALNTAATRAEMLPIILDQLVSLLAADAVAFSRLDADTGDSVIEAARGALAAALRARVPAGEGVSGHVMSSGRPYLNNDASAEALIADPQALGELRAVACAPLIADQEVIGALWIARHHAIDEDELHILTAVADIAANAMSRALLHQQTRRQVERLASLHTIDVAIASSFDLHLSLNVLVQQIVTRLKIDAAAVLLLDPLTLRLGYAAGQGFRSRAIEATNLPLGEGYAGRAALERKMESIPDFGARVVQGRDERMRNLQPEGFVAYYAAPLIVKSQVRGVLELFHRSPLPAEEEWLEFVETLAQQAAIAIDNGRMFDDLQRSNTELGLAYDATIEGWSRALDLRDKETEGHTQRVADLTVRLARAR